MPQASPQRPEPNELLRQIGELSRELGFHAFGVTGVELGDDEARLLHWLKLGRHGDMDYMQRHGTLRSRPAELRPGTLSIISLRMDYYPALSAEPWSIINNPHKAFISRYALGRDYHKLLRARLSKLATRLGERIGEFSYRVFTDSAPLMEKPLARNAGLGWIGKHTNLISREAGSWFFLGEILTDLPLPTDAALEQTHCGSCTACIDICPTAAIPAPYELDARRCISYLTIELRGPIPLELRPLIGNRIYGCDDCQLVCPWNKFASASGEADFSPRHGLDHSDLITLFAWNEQTFLKNTEGSPIRRIGHECWLRNIAVALGNGPANAESIRALEDRLDHPSTLVREHVQWALDRLTSKTHPN